MLDEPYRLERCVKDIILVKKWRQKNSTFVEEKLREGLEKKNAIRPTTTSREIGGWYSFIPQEHFMPPPKSYIHGCETVSIISSDAPKYCNSNSNLTSLTKENQSIMKENSILQSHKNAQSSNLISIPHVANNSMISQSSSIPISKNSYISKAQPLQNSRNSSLQNKNLLNFSTLSNVRLRQTVNTKTNSARAPTIKSWCSPNQASSSARAASRFHSNHLLHSNRTSRMKNGSLLKSKNEEKERNRAVKIPQITGIKKERTPPNQIHENRPHNTLVKQGSSCKSSISTRSFGMQAKLDTDLQSQISFSVCSSRGPGTTISNISSHVPSEISYTSDVSLRKQIASRMSRSRIFPPTVKL